MTLIPQTFPIPQETAIASYNYTDIAEGTGVITYYGFDANDDTTLDYHLSINSSIYAQNKVFTTATTGGGSTKSIDLDFDVIFNLPQRIKGTAYCNITTFVDSNVTGATSYFFIVKLRKYDGSTESEIVSGQTKSRTNSGNSNVREWTTHLVPLPITTQVQFKKGEILRVTIEGWSNRSTGSGNFGFAQDPANRAEDNADTTQLQNFIPFILDI